jgi:hypothetical protein
MGKAKIETSSVNPHWFHYIFLHRRSLEPSYNNIKPFKTKYTIPVWYILFFLGHLCPPGSGYGSNRLKSMRIRIGNTDQNLCPVHSGSESPLGKITHKKGEEMSCFEVLNIYFEALTSFMEAWDKKIANFGPQIPGSGSGTGPG